MLPEFLQYGFMIRAIAAGSIIGFIGPLIGIFIVVRRYSLLADALAHVSLLGIAIGIFFQINPIVSAIVTAVASGLGIERLRSSSKLYPESLLLLFMTGSLAVGIILISLSKTTGTNILGYLFGSIVTVSWLNLAIIGLLGILVVAVIVVLYRDFFLLSYDEELAKANGIPTSIFGFILIELAALTVGLSMTVVGILLVQALMVIPVITAMLFKKSFKGTIILSIIFSEIAVFSGLIASYYFDIGSGGMIIAISVSLFSLSLFIRRFFMS